MPERQGAAAPRSPTRRELARPDVFFPVLHGTFGEDGTVQGLFELAAVPYVGAGVAASAAAMDKAMMKSLFAHAGLPQVDVPGAARRDPGTEAHLAARARASPLFVKPANLGSSVAVSKVKSPDASTRALGRLRLRPKVLLEAGTTRARSRSPCSATSDPEASAPRRDHSRPRVLRLRLQVLAGEPDRARAPRAHRRRPDRGVRGLAIAAFRAVEGAGYARVDFFLEKPSGRLLVNEINTIPGFTSISMYPKLWELSGVSCPELVARLVDLALEHHEKRGRLRTDYRG